MNVSFSGQPTLVRQCVEVHMKTSLMSLCLFSAACLACLFQIFCVIGGTFAVQILFSKGMFQELFENSTQHPNVVPI